MDTQNGQTKNLTPGNHQGNCTHQSAGLGFIRQPSEGDEHNQIGINQEDCSGRDSLGSSLFIGDPDLGKMSQRLDKLEEYLDKYIHAHQERLKARLNESKILEEQFRLEAAELRKEIYRLASERNANGNGRIN